jgi:hypothetical protein
VWAAFEASPATRRAPTGAVDSGKAPGAVSSVWEVAQKRGDGGGLLGTWLFASMEKKGMERCYLKGN